MVLYKKVNGKRIKLTKKEETALRKEWKENEAKQAANKYREDRRAEYDPMGDQVDRLCKCLMYLRANGVDIGPDGDELVDRIKAVKDKYPKPE